MNAREVHPSATRIEPGPIRWLEKIATGACDERTLATQRGLDAKKSYRACASPVMSATSSATEVLVGRLIAAEWIAPALIAFCCSALSVDSLQLA